MNEQSVKVNTKLMRGFTENLIKYINDIVQQNDSNNDNKEDYYLFFLDFLKKLTTLSESVLYITVDSFDRNSDLFLETQLWNLFYHLIQNDDTLTSELNRILNIRKWLESMMRKPSRPFQSVFENKNMFFEYLFELVLSGQYDKAIKEAMNAKNHNLAMTLSGFKVIEVSEDSVADGLWKNLIKTMSDDINLCPYERMLYKYISGSSLTLLDDPLKKIVDEFDWSTKLLFHVKNIIDDYVEAKSKNFADFDVTEKLKDSFDDVFSSEPIKNPIKDIIYFLIFNKLDLLLDDFKAELQDSLEGKKTALFYGNEYLLRIMAQLCIISSTIDRDVINKDIKDAFISVYIKSMIVEAKETSQTDILNSIYAYIYYLEPENQLEIYTELLKYIDSTEDKKKQKQAAESLGLPFKSFLMKMSEDLFENMKAKDLERSEIIKSQTMNDDITDEQKEIINCIDYLIVAAYYERAIDLLLSSIKLFLVKKSVGAFIVLMDKIDLDKIISICELNDKTQESQTLQDFAKLKTCLVLLKDWNVYVKGLEQSNDIVEFTNKEQLLTVKLTQCAMECFDFVNNEDDDRALYLVKCIYVPYLFIQIHKILEFSSDLLGQKTLAKDALDLAKIVTDKTKQYHYLFNSSHTLELYVEMVTKTYVKVLDEE